MEYIVYILYSEKCDKYYVGQSEDLQKRLYEHNNNKGGKFSKSYSPWKLVYHENYVSRIEAIAREKEIKNKKSRKYIELLIGFRASRL